MFCCNRALVASAGDRVDLEIGLPFNSATALNLAAFAGTAELIEVIIEHASGGAAIGPFSARTLFFTTCMVGLWIRIWLRVCQSPARTRRDVSASVMPWECDASAMQVRCKMKVRCAQVR